MLIGYANTIILMPMYMSPDEIGLFRVLMSISMLLVTIVLFGMGGVVMRYYPLRETTEKGVNETFTLSMVVIMLSFLLVTWGVYFAEPLIADYYKDNAPNLTNYLLLIVLITLQMAIFNLLEVIIRTKKEIILPNVIRDMVYKSLHVVVILLYGLNVIQFDDYLYSHVAIYCILIIALLLPVLKRTNLQIDISIFSDRPAIKEMMKYGVINILTGLGITIVLQIDQIMVTKYLGLSANGVYSTALFMAVVIEYPRRFVAQVSYPIMAEAFARNDFKLLDEHYKKASINQMILGGLLFLGIYINLDNIFGIMPHGQEYAMGWWVLVVVGMVKLVDMLFSLNGEIISLSKHYKYNTYFVLALSVLAVITNDILIPLLGITGAAIATLISYVLFNVMKYILLKVKFGFEPFTMNNLYHLLILIGCILLNFLVPKFENIIIDIFIRSSIMSMIYIFACYLFNISELFTELVDKAIAFSGIKKR